VSRESIKEFMVKTPDMIELMQQAL
jgi:hypothetical protein